MKKTLRILAILLLTAVYGSIASPFLSIATAQTCGGVFDPESYSGSPYQKVQAAIDAATGCGPQGGTVVLAKKYNLANNEMLRIAAANVNLRGPGSLYGTGTQAALLAIGPAPGPGVTPIDMDFVIDGVSFAYGSLQSNRDGIILQNARKGRILNCRFNKTDRAIHVLAASPVNTFQHVAKLTMTNNVFGFANYALKVDSNLPNTTTWESGDFTFTNNIAYGDINVGHVYAEWMDGIIIANNTFFFPSHAAVPQSQTKSNNIYIDHGDWVNIQGNNLFEAGLDAIDLHHVGDLNIAGNNIAWPGQRIPGSGIRISEGNPAGQEYVLGSICGNNIASPTYHGIDVEGAPETQTSHIAITGNQIWFPGDPTYYYGTILLSSLLHYGVVVAGVTHEILTVANLTSMPPESSWRTNFLFGDRNYFSKNFDGYGNVEEHNLSVALASDTTIDAHGVRELNLSRPSAHTITSIINGFSGQEITLIALNGNTTLMNTGFIKLKNGLSVTIPTDGTLTLRLAANTVWFEIARSF